MPGLGLSGAARLLEPFPCCPHPTTSDAVACSVPECRPQDVREAADSASAAESLPTHICRQIGVWQRPMVHMACLEVSRIFPMAAAYVQT